MRRFPFCVETKVAGEDCRVLGDIFAPAQDVALRQAVLFCFPGGGVTRVYYDIPGAESFSFVRAMTQLGYVCATLDHPGTGESSGPVDGFAVTAAEIAAAGAVAVRRVAEDLCLGRVDPSLAPIERFKRIAVGHSMGAMIVTLQQASSPWYDGAALLCFTTRGLPEVLTDAERAVAAAPVRTGADFARLARARFGEPFPVLPQARGESAAAVALAQVQGRLATVSAIQSMLPGNIETEAALMRVPVFLAAGDRDLTGPPHDIPASFPGSDDVRLVVVRNAGHHPFVTQGAAGLYAKLAEWIETVKVAA